jgi:2-polyprenyl-6-methoxyphenol hydroxylase-like FAD-dependent oxidoreductase
LQAALAARFGFDGLTFDADVSGFTQDGAAVELTLRNRKTIAGDLLVGADGLRSTVRQGLLGDGDPVYLGSTIWRGILHADGMGVPASTGLNWVGRGSEFLVFQLRGERLYWAAVTKELAGERMGAAGHRGDLMKRFGDWVQPVPRLIDATDEAAILRNDMYDRPTTRRWSRGRVTLVGDAAHPMTPNAGQGACQALEDAVALGHVLTQTNDPAEAFRLYERRRVRRVNRVVAMSRQATRAVQIDNPFLCALRDGVAYPLAERLFLRTLDGILAPDE